MDVNQFNIITDKVRKILSGELLADYSWCDGSPHLSGENQIMLLSQCIFQFESSSEYSPAIIELSKQFAPRGIRQKLNDHDGAFDNNCLMFSLFDHLNEKSKKEDSDFFVALRCMALYYFLIHMEYFKEKKEMIGPTIETIFNDNCKSAMNWNYIYIYSLMEKNFIDRVTDLFNGDPGYNVCNLYAAIVTKLNKLKPHDLMTLDLNEAANNIDNVVRTELIEDLERLFGCVKPSHKGYTTKLYKNIVFYNEGYNSTEFIWGDKSTQEFITVVLSNFHFYRCENDQNCKNGEQGYIKYTVEKQITEKKKEIDLLKQYIQHITGNELTKDIHDAMINIFPMFLYETLIMTDDFKKHFNVKKPNNYKDVFEVCLNISKEINSKYNISEDKHYVMLYLFQLMYTRLHIYNLNVGSDVKFDYGVYSNFLQIINNATLIPVTKIDKVISPEMSTIYDIKTNTTTGLNKIPSTDMHARGRIQIDMSTVFNENNYENRLKKAVEKLVDIQITPPIQIDNKSWLSRYLSGNNINLLNYFASLQLDPNRHYHNSNEFNSGFIVLIVTIFLIVAVIVGNILSYIYRYEINKYVRHILLGVLIIPIYLIFVIFRTRYNAKKESTFIKEIISN